MFFSRIGVETKNYWIYFSWGWNSNGVWIYTLIDSADKNHQSIFHVTLADPTMYQHGVFTDSFEIQEGSYYFAFVPNGDSPQTIAISLKGPNYYSMERFVLHSDF